ncbi:hypothetical protein ACU4GD_44590 [Cupriavidus basilensis]
MSARVAARQPVETPENDHAAQPFDSSPGRAEGERGASSVGTEAAGRRVPARHQPVLQCRGGTEAPEER